MSNQSHTRLYNPAEIVSSYHNGSSPLYQPNPSIAVSEPTTPATVVTFDIFDNTINEVQQNIQAPDTLVRMTAFAAISIACQHLIDVQLPIGNTSPTSLMLFMVADSGERKSAVEKKLFASIREIEKAQFDLYTEQYAEWKINNSVIQQKQKGLNDAIRKKSSKGLDTLDEEMQLKEVEQKRVPPPRKCKLLYEDVTSEALFSGLSHDFPAAGLVSSEGVNILKSTAFKDFGTQNKIWSGESVVVDRVKGESYSIVDARLTVFIMVQPGILQDYLEKEGQNARSSGLLARALMYQPESTQGQRHISNTTTSWQHIDRFNNRVKQLLEMSVNREAKERQLIKFSPEATQDWLNYVNSIEGQINPPGIYHQVKDHASKLAENVARVAALLHFFEGYEGDISRTTLDIAINICGSCSEYFMQIFNAPPQEEEDANLLINWLYSNMQNQIYPFSRYTPKNAVRQKGPNQLRHTERLDKAIKVLVNHGKIVVVSYGRTKYLDIFPNLPQYLGFNFVSL